MTPFPLRRILWAALYAVASAAALAFLASGLFNAWSRLDEGLYTRGTLAIVLWRMGAALACAWLAAFARARGTSLVRPNAVAGASARYRKVIVVPPRSS